MEPKLTELATKVEGTADLKRATEVLVTGVADYLDSLTQDPVAIKRAASDLRSSAPKFGAAILANAPTHNKTEPSTKQEAQPAAHAPQEGEKQKHSKGSMFGK